LGEHERAIVDLNEALRIDPSDENRALVNRCAAKLMLERLPEALADCDEAVRHQSYDYPLSVRALVYLKMTEYALSIQDSNAALLCETSPYYRAMALYARGIAKRERGDRSDGNSDMAAATELVPSIAQEIRRYGVR